MMYYVNKIVGWCVSPLGMCFLGLTLGWLLLKLKRGGRWARRAGIGVAVLSLLQLWVFSCDLTVRAIGLPLEGVEVDEASLPNADAIILLGGGMGYHGRCGRAEITSGADRVWLAAKLYKAGKASVIFSTGGGVAGSTGPLLVDLGVPTNAVKFLSAARNTEEESRFIRDAMRKAKGEGKSCKPTVLLVTSAWHMPRARMLFERAGFGVVEAPTDYEAHYIAEMPIAFGDLFPSNDGLWRNSAFIKEWVARFCYWVIGG